MAGSGGFTVELAQKDLGHMKRLSTESRVPMPTLEAMLAHLQQAMAAGRGGLDWGAMALSIQDNANQQ